MFLKTNVVVGVGWTMINTHQQELIVIKERNDFQSLYTVLKHMFNIKLVRKRLKTHLDKDCENTNSASIHPQLKNTDTWIIEMMSSKEIAHH